MGTLVTILLILLTIVYVTGAFLVYILCAFVFDLPINKTRTCVFVSIAWPYFFYRGVRNGNIILR